MPPVPQPPPASAQQPAPPPQGGVAKLVAGSAVVGAAGLLAGAAAIRQTVRTAGQLVNALAEATGAVALATISAVRELGEAAAREVYQDVPLGELRAEQKRRAEAFSEKSKERVRKRMQVAVTKPTKKDVLKVLDTKIERAKAEGKPDGHLQEQRAVVLTRPGPREKAMKEALEAEARLAKAHARAAVARDRGFARQRYLEQVSPEGAVWRLGKAKNHTPECLALAGKVWSHHLLRVTRPPIHAGCACWLQSVKAAQAEGIVPSPLPPRDMKAEADAFAYALGLHKDHAEDKAVAEALAEAFGRGILQEMNPGLSKAKGMGTSTFNEADVRRGPGGQFANEANSLGQRIAPTPAAAKGPPKPKAPREVLEDLAKNGAHMQAVTLGDVKVTVENADYHVPQLRVEGGDGTPSYFYTAAAAAQDAKKRNVEASKDPIEQMAAGVRASQSINLSAGPKRTEALKALGHDDSAIEAVDAWRRAWDHGGQTKVQWDAREEMLAALRAGDSPAAKALRAAVQLETRMLREYIAGKAERQEAIEAAYEEQIARDEDEASGFGGLERPLPDDVLERRKREAAQVRDAQLERSEESNWRLYRRGEPQGISSWTTDPEGANTQGLTNPDGDNSRIEPDRRMTFDETLKDYAVLGGLLQHWGAPGESEVTLVKRSELGDFDPEGPLEQGVKTK